MASQPTTLLDQPTMLAQKLGCLASKVRDQDAAERKQQHRIYRPNQFRSLNTNFTMTIKADPTQADFTCLQCSEFPALVAQSTIKTAKTPVQDYTTPHPFHCPGPALNRNQSSHLRLYACFRVGSAIVAIRAVRSAPYRFRFLCHYKYRNGRRAHLLAAVPLLRGIDEWKDREI